MFCVKHLVAVLDPCPLIHGVLCHERPTGSPISSRQQLPVSPMIQFKHQSGEQTRGHSKLFHAVWDISSSAVFIL